VRNGEQGHMQIGQVAARTQLSVRTVRYYHDVGLLTPSARSSGGFRLYTDDDVERLLVIRGMKPLGFTLEEMKQLLEALEHVDDAHATKSQHQHAAQQLDEFRTKVAESAARMRRQLAYAEQLTEFLTTGGAHAAGKPCGGDRGNARRERPG
jgi:DNA-binding transcriptional MerR regulator